MKPSSIAVILVAPENVDNIGAVARAVKNMGFSDLRLVNPPRSWKIKGQKMAMSAADILQQARTFCSLRDAVHDRQFLIGTTRRRGGQREFFLPFSEAIKGLQKRSSKQKIGIVFGCESKGLANQDLGLCDHAVAIPASSAYPSLNLAQAVMVILFSLTRQDIEKRSKAEDDEPLLNKKEIEITIQHFQKALEALGYRTGGAELLPRILQTTRGLIKRSGLLEKEAQMIKGLSRRIREKVLCCSGEKGRIPKKES